MFTFTVATLNWFGPLSPTTPNGNTGTFATVTYNDPSNTVVVQDLVELKTGISLVDAQKAIQRRFEDVLPDLQTALARQDLTGFTGHS